MIIDKMEAQQQSEIELAKSQFRQFTYRKPWIFDRTLDDNLPAQSGLQNQMSSSPKASLGTFNTLPVEMLHNILAQMDLRTLTDFQRVNRGTWHMVASLPQFKAIDTHAPKVLRGILSISMGPWITLDTLHQALCTAECASCGAFGGFLYILTCTRVCYLCFTQHDDYLPLRRLHATQRFALTRPLLKTLAVPTMRSQAGSYSYSQRYHPQIGLVDGRSAHQAGIAFHGSVAAIEERVNEAAERKLRDWAAKIPVRRPPGINVPRDDEDDNPLRYMAIVRAPWLDRISQSAEWGAHCQGCTNECGRDGDSDIRSEILLHRQRMFNVASFDAHLRQQGAIENGRHSFDSQQKSTNQAL